MLLRLPHDHTGAFAQGLDGINTVETELADNDYARRPGGAEGGRKARSPRTR